MTDAEADEPTAPWIIDPPTGWPAPFDLVQGLFEGAWAWINSSIDDAWRATASALGDLWNGIVRAINDLWNNIVKAFSDLWDNIVKAVWDLWNNLVKAFSDLYLALCDWVSGGLEWLKTQITTYIGYWDSAKGRFVGGFLGWLWDAVAGVFNTLWGYFSGFGAWLTDCFMWVYSKITEWGSGLWTWLVDSFDWLHSEVVGWLTGAMETVAGAIGAGLKALWDWLSETIPAFLAGAASFINEHVIAPIMGALQWLFDRISDAIAGLISSIENLFKGHSPITGEEALTIGVLAAITAGVSGGGITALVDIASTKVAASGLELRAIGRYLVELVNPRMFLGAVIGVMVATGIRMPLMHHYRKFFRPTIPAVREAQEMYWRGKLTLGQLRDVLAMTGYRDIYEEGFIELTAQIPPATDLITMVVREAFVPEMVIEAPKIFAEYMVKKGFNKEWSDRYWTAHFVPIALAQAYDNLYRGFWTKEQFMRALHIADIHPMWREDIYNVAFRPPSIRELGYGYDTAVYTREDIVKYRRYGGLSPEDAEKAGTAMVAYRTEAEREALRREALADYEAGLDTEEELRAKLEAIGGRPEIIDLWVSRAKYREERDIKVDIIKVVKDQFVKGYMTEAELRENLAEIGVKPVRIEVHVVEAETRRLTAKKEQDAEKKRLLTEAKIAKAWELGLIGDEEYVSQLIERNYTPEDARLQLEILRTPMPVTPEEIERRRKSVEARVNRTRRRYEIMIARVDRNAGLVSSEIESVETEYKESLDVIDSQISAIEEDIRAITPEVLRKPILEAMARVRRRYERMLTRLDMQAAATEAEIKSTEWIYLETLDVIDVNIKYVEEELIALGAVP